MIRLIVNDEDVEGVSDLLIASNKQAADVGELVTRKANFTRSFSVPFTPNNDRILQNTKNPKSLTSFPYTLQRVKLIEDGLELIPEGRLIVQRCQGRYALYILSGPVGFFDAIKGKKITDIDLDDLNGPWGNTSDILSYSLATEGVVAPIVNYFDDNSLTSDPFEMPNSQNIPSIYYHTLLKRIINDAGYDYSGNIFTSERFTKMIVPLLRADNKYDPAFTQALNAAAVKTVPQVIASPGAGTKVTFNQTTKQDARGFWSLADSTYHAVWPSVSADHALFKVDVSYVIDITVTGGTVDIITRGGEGDDFHNNIGTGVHTLSTTEWFKNYSPGDSMYVINDPTSVNSDIFLQIRVNTGSPSVTVNSGKIVITISGEPLGSSAGGFADSVRFFGKLLPDMTQEDFFKDFAMRFGLLFKEEQNVLYTKSYNEIISNVGQAQDWTTKRTTDPEELRFTPLSYAQRNVFKYAGAFTDLGAGQFDIANETIEQEKTVYESPFESIETKVVSMIDLVDEIVGNILMANVPAFKVSDFSYTNPGPVLLMVREKYSYEPDVRYGPSGTTSTYLVAYFIDPDQTNTMSFQQSIDDDYSFLVAALQKAKVTTRRYNLSPMDFMGIDFFAPIFDKDSFFLVNNIQDRISGRSTTSELLKL